MNNTKATLKKGNPAALLPILIFLILFIGSGIITKDFYAMPTIVAFLIALAVAFLQNKELSFSEKLKLCAKGIGDENVVTMCLIFLAAGAFSGAVTAAGGADSTVYLGLSLIPAKFAVVGIFLIGCFVSVSMGTSVGTITALAPIAVGVSEATGFNMALCLAAVVSGAMFGDNLSMISDTTIAAVRTQGCEMSDKFKMNFKIVLPAAIVTAIIYFVSTLGAASEVELGEYNIIQVIPYLLVLGGAMARYETVFRKIPTWLLPVMWLLFRALAFFECTWLFDRLGSEISLDLSFFGWVPALILLELSFRFRVPIPTGFAKLLRRMAEYVYILHPLVAMLITAYLPLPPMVLWIATIILCSTLYLLLEKNFVLKR
jgi:Na+/H+ antiporter NhaC